MSDEVLHDDERSVTGTPGPGDAEGVEQVEPATGEDQAPEPEGAEVLLPKSNWLRIAWVVIATFWMIAVVAIFLQSCSPR